MEAYEIHAQRLRTQADGMDSRVVQRIRMGQGASPAQYQQLLARREDWIQRMAQVLTGFDAVVCPTVPLTAPSTASVLASHEAFFQVNGLLLRNTALFNFMDGCSISLPCQAPGERPVGLMLSAVRGQDAHLLSVAAEVEQALRF
jgi:aspartyl-tRNA(Asn)/glutamyl-tRNA(Gln) amidotransferase subunit A